MHLTKRHWILCILFIAIFSTAAYALIQTDIIYDMDDTYVNDSSTGTNYDGQTLKTGNNGGNTEAWFLFNLSKPSGYYVTNAVLWTYTYSASGSNTYNIHKSDTAGWTETGLTWSNKPGYGSTLAQNDISAAGWQSWAITNTLSNAFSSGDAAIAYALETSGAGSYYADMDDKENTEGTGNEPYLNLTMMIPEVYLLSPPDATNTYNTTITFSYNTTDAGNIDNCSILIDGAVNKTNTSVVENTTSTFTVTGIAPGSHTWAIRCYDSNRQVYEINPGTRNFVVLAKVEWNPSSATRLDLGTGVLGGTKPTGSRNVYSNNSNNNVVVSCTSGDCATITTNWTTRDMAGGEEIEAGFNCSTTTADSFEAEFSLDSDQDATADILTVNCTIQAPDLRISAVNITFSTNYPAENQVVTVTAGIYNDGDYEATDAVVRFYEGNYSLGEQIGTDKTVTLAAGSSTTVQQNWTAKVGSYDIYMVLDPPGGTSGSIAESDETNNNAYNTISTSMWTIFLGNVTGYLVMGTADNRTLLKWGVTDTTNSNIYITDTDSNPTFNSLVALGRNTTGAYMSNDFTEFDSALNTTNYPDSINLTFTSGGNPIQTQAFTIFGVTINDVPIVESTNTTTFVTGILWDSSDDTNNNHQFDNTSKEDIVLVTVVNQSKYGKYGFYDYEIKVPARLDNYKGPDSQNVALYTELK
jgi:hypothetical protein